MDSERKIIIKVSQDVSEISEPELEILPENLPIEESSDPISMEKFHSIEELKNKLLETGPSVDTYNKIFELVGRENEDSAKDALSKFFEGSSTALCFLYKMLILKNKADILDEELVTEIIQMHPELDPKKKEESKEVEGLWIPPCVKTAGGFLGGTNAGCSYIMNGPDEKKICPKIRNSINTFICRFHCLDGLIIDDNQVLCGEAIWRQAIMDKFSREYKGKDGKWVGGYLRGRFHIEENTEGNSYQLKPGQRNRPIKESAWSTEKRLQEMRKEEGEKRGYKEVYEPNELYNFDQHKICNGPDNVQLSEKKRDEIAKNAHCTKEIKVSQSMFDDDFSGEGDIGDLAKQDPREFYPPEEEEMKEELISSSPQDGDIITMDRNNWYQYGKVFISGSEQDLKEKLENENFIPKIWEISGENTKNISSEIYGDNNIVEAKSSGKKKYKKIVPEKDFESCKKQVKENQPDLPEGSEYAICTKSLKGQPESYKKRKSFNLKDVRTSQTIGRDVFNQGDGFSPVAKKCPKCGDVEYTPGNKCPRCGSPTTVITKNQKQMESGVISKPKAFASDLKLSCANGVIMAKMGELTAFGETKKDAVDKLKEMIPGTSVEESEELGELLDSPITEKEPTKNDNITTQPNKQLPLAQDNTESVENEPITSQEIDATIAEDLADNNKDEQMELDELADKMGIF